MNVSAATSVSQSPRQLQKALRDSEIAATYRGSNETGDDWQAHGMLP